MCVLLLMFLMDVLVQLKEKIGEAMCVLLLMFLMDVLVQLKWLAWLK